MAEEKAGMMTNTKGRWWTTTIIAAAAQFGMMHLWCGWECRRGKEEEEEADEDLKKTGNLFQAL
jgi:hypothetical protein